MRLTVITGVGYDHVSFARPLPCIDTSGRTPTRCFAGATTDYSARVDPMFQAITWAGVWLVQRGAALPDTVYTKQIAAVPGIFDRITGIASGVLTIAICIFVIAAVPAAWNFRRSYQRVNQLLERIYGDINPI